MTDASDFFSKYEGQDEAETEAPQEAQEVEGGREGGDDPEAGTGPETGEDQGAAKASDTPPPGDTEGNARTVPLSAHLDERERRQKAQREAEEYRAEIERLRAPQKSQKKDFYDDPEGALQRMRDEIKAEFQAERREHNLQSSMERMEREHPGEVEKVMAFFDDPRYQALSHRFADMPDPLGAAREFMRRETFMSEVSDPDKWREAEREKLRAELLAESKKTSPPPRSAASGKSAGTDAGGIVSEMDRRLNGG